MSAQDNDGAGLVLAWFGEGVDHRAARQAILDEDTGERRTARAEILEALDDALTSLGEHMATLTSVASEVLPPCGPPHDTILEMPAAKVPAAEPEPEPEPTAAETRSEDDLAAEAEASPPATSAPQAAATDPELLPTGMVGWQVEIELLYSDVLRLFSLGDTDGALVSFERLLIVAPINDQIRTFLRFNESKLMKLYEGVMGPWSNVPRRIDNLQAANFFQQHAKFKTILHLVDGKRDLGAILDESYFLALETCAVLNQMIRAKVILAHDVPA